MTSLLRSFFFILVLTLAALRLSGQEQATATTVPPPPRQGPDSTLLVFYFVNAPERAIPGNDTMPGASFRMYDPARRQPIDYGTLGNLGSASRPLWYDIVPRRGFATGVRIFDLYRLNPEMLRFYRNRKTVSEVSFSRGATQNDGMSTAQLSRTFSRGLNVSIDYRTFNNQGLFRRQRTKHSQFSAGIWYPVTKRYEFFLIYTGNTFRQQDSGGLLTDTIFGKGGQFDNPIDAPIRLDDATATTRFSDWNIYYTHYLKFGNPEKRAFRAAHTISYNKESFKFSHVFGDQESEYANDSAFYGALLTDVRGLRNYISVNRLDNTFLLSTYKIKSTGKPSDGFAAGIRYSAINLQQEPLQNDHFSNVFLTGNLSITPSDRLALTGQADLGVLKNTGQLQILADAHFGLGILGVLKGNLLVQRRPADQMQYRAFASKRLLWDNNFDQVIENAFSVGYALPKIGFEASGRLQTITNYLYFDQLTQPRQISGTLSVGQFMLRENFKIGPIQMENTVGFQAISNTDVLHLPKWFTKNSLYFSGKIFKKNMLFNAGADFRMNSEFRPDAYQPLLGQFHLQDTVSQKPYPWLDVFLTVKIQSFRLFFRYENILMLANPEKVFYQTAWHPQNFNTFRVGINWRFMDSNLPQSSSSQQGQQGPPTGIGGGGGSRPRF